jgi:hypothetical protein
MEDKPVRDRLKKKLKKKKAAEGIEITEEQDDTDLFKMISQVQSVLKKNPALVNKVSKCVNSLMTNPEIMNQLSSQFQNTQFETTRASSSSEVELEADSK